MEAVISKKYATDLFLNESVIHRGTDSIATSLAKNLLS